jgi:hypothetical protein
MAREFITQIRDSKRRSGKLSYGDQNRSPIPLIETKTNTAASQKALSWRRSMRSLHRIPSNSYKVMLGLVA